MIEKKWWQSTTLWINILGVVAIAIQIIIKSGSIPDADIVAILVAVLNIVNRFRVTAETEVKPIEKSII
jgi:hypothetical protein